MPPYHTTDVRAVINHFSPPLTGEDVNNLSKNLTIYLMPLVQNFNTEVVDVSSVIASFSPPLTRQNKRRLTRILNDMVNRALRIRKELVRKAKKNERLVIPKDYTAVPVR